MKPESRSPRFSPEWWRSRWRKSRDAFPVDVLEKPHILIVGGADDTTNFPGHRKTQAARDNASAGRRLTHVADLATIVA